MTNQSELEQRLKRFHIGIEMEGIARNTLDDRSAKEIATYITGNYTPINQPSTNTAPVGGDSSGKQSTNQSEQSAKNAHSFDEQIDEILTHSLKRGYFNGSTDVKARESGVIPNNTKLGEVMIQVLVTDAKQQINQAVKDHIIADILGMCLETKHPGEFPSVDALMTRDRIVLKYLVNDTK